MNKRGVSQIVSTILIILLVLVAIGIVWVVIERLVRGGGGIIEAKAACIGVDLTFVGGSLSCNSTTNIVTATVKRGADNVGAIDMILVVENTASTGETAPNSLGSLAATSIPSPGEVTDNQEITVKVAPKIEDQVCDPTQVQIVTCKA